MRTTFLVLVLSLAAAFPAAAQEFRATLTGRITDPAGAAVGQAQVVLSNPDTAEHYRSPSDPSGNFTFALIKPGNYEVAVEHPGFRKYIRRGLTLSVNQSAELNVSLQLGDVTQTVTVTAETPLLETASADRGGVIDETVIKEMPLNGRNPFMLSMLVPGVNYNGSLAYMRPFDNGAIADWGISGGENRSNEFLMDGVPNNAQAGGNNIAYVPPVDAVQEFKIQTNSYDAQYGKTAGGIVNVVLKSGTNRLHGTLYEFARRNSWDANSFQNNARGAIKDGHKLDQYGFQLDGPVIIPKLYNGRGKTFFLMNWEGFDEATPQPLVLSVPAMEMRTGDFSKLTDPRGRAVSIYDPVTTFPIPANRYDRLPFPSNIIPQSRINPIAQKLIGYFPQPNVTTSNASYSQSNYFLSGGDNPARDTFYNFVVKIDQNLGSKHRMFFRHASNDRTEDRNTNGIRTTPGQDGQHPLKRINDAYVVDWVSTLRPTLLFNFRSSFARYVEGSSGDANRGFDMTSLGFPTSLVSQLPGGPWFGRYTFAEYISLGRYPSRNVTNTVTAHPTVTWINGPRTWKAGLDMRWSQYSTQNSGNVFLLGANRGFTQRDFQRADEFSGNSIASWLLGTPASGSMNYAVFPIFFFPYYAPWVQNDWKITRTVSVNLGLRMDFNIPPTERYNRMNRGFDPNMKSPVNELIDRSQFDTFPELTGSMLFAGQNGVSRNAANIYGKAIQPRIGVAWAVARRTVLRGGWGRYYINPNNDYLQTNGYSQSTPYANSGTEGRTGVENKIANPFPNGIRVPKGSSNGPLSYIGQGFNFVNSNFKIAHTDQYSFGIQHLFTSKSRFEITYAASRGNELQSSRTFNEDDPDLRDSCNFMLGGNPSVCDQALTNPFFNVEAFNDTSWYLSRTLNRYQLSRPFPQFGAITELMRNDGKSWYNSLQTSFNIRNKYTTFNANYTWSKNIEQNNWLDPLRGVMQRGLTAYDRPHRFVVSAVSQLPFGRGRSFGRNLSGWKSRLISGWDNSVIISQQSGIPWNLPGNVIQLAESKIDADWSGATVQAIQPCVNRWNENNTVTMLRYSEVDFGCKSASWLVVPRFNPRYTPFRSPKVRLQSTFMVDTSLNKTTHITERLRVQFRAEAFNLMNSFFVVSSHFNNNPESVTFGSIEKAALSAPQSNYPRQIQLAVKLIW
ncbi:MAG: carboxypeptidase regulatory-like domain-containing protein [Bryobacteraceae bacterium]|nr:carboxypeptidase regulatory-like domain-containing protein [Bryobacteraceae bacterium]